MKVEVWLFSTLKKYLPPNAKGKKAVVELPEGATLADLADHLGLHEEAIVPTVNDEQAHWGLKLKDGDRVSFFPPLAGGRSHPPSG
jgi:molybdopterin converting factor small subunit